MLKLLLNHWQSHREPLPFVLTDDPLYCSHLTKSPFPEVYSVNRINPIFEEDEEKASNVSTAPPSVKRVPGDGYAESEQFKTYPADRKTVKSIVKSKDPFASNFLLRKPISKPILNENAYSLNSHFKYYSPDSILDTNSAHPLSLKRSASEERREDETKSSDDTGYSSSGQFKSSATLESDGSVEIHPMSSDSDDCSRPEAVIVSADVHRVSTPDDVLVRSPSSDSSANYSYRSYDSSPEPFDSLTMSSATDTSVKDTEVRRPNSVVREKLQRLLEKGNSHSEDRKTIVEKDEMEIQKTKSDLMKSLTRALNNKVPKREIDDEVVTRVEDTNSKSVTIDRKSNTSSTSPKRLITNSDSSGITRQDESNSSSLSSFSKPKKHLLKNNKLSSEKEHKSTEESSDSQKTHKCKICENAHRPLALHQLLPGHWSYDNIYLPQMHSVICPCMHPHHGLSIPPSSDEDSFYPMFYHQNLSRVRHSWAPYTNGHGPNTENKGVSTSSKENNSKPHPRYSPDGETDSSNGSSNQLKKSLSERRSLKEHKKCKCEHCLDMIVDKCPNAHHNCPCYCLAHRRVKFASDSDLSQHRHLQSFRMKSALANSDPINPALVMSLPHLNGHVASKGNMKDNGKSPPLIPRGLKEPIKMDELYRSYPINFRDWEAHYRRNFHQKRKKRALAMVSIAIGIILAVGIAVGLTFVFLRIRRPVS